MSISESRRGSVPPLDSEPYAPTAERPCRCMFRPHLANTEVEQHCHPWAQMIFSSKGVVRISADKTTFTVPPWRAVWIPPNTFHTATVIENAQLHALFLLSKTKGSRWRHGFAQWSNCQVIEVRPLLRELVIALAKEDLDKCCQRRYESLVELTISEIKRAPILSLGITLPSEKRLLKFCKKFLDEPRIDRSLIELAQDAGASASTINRLFQTEIGCSFSAWRKQVLFAEALALAAKGFSINQIACELGYSNQSSFSFMFTQLAGVSPGKLLKSIVNK